MSHRTASRPGIWGPAAITTLVVIGALCIGGTVGFALFWATEFYDPNALAHTVTAGVALLLIAVIGRLEIRWGRRLLRSYRRQS